MKTLFITGIVFIMNLIQLKSQDFKLIIGDTLDLSINKTFSTPNNLDLDNNGSIDYLIECDEHQQSYNGEYFRSVVIKPFGNNEIYYWPAYVNAVDTLNENDTLKSKGRWRNDREFWFNASFFNESHQNILVGAWPNQTKYVGVRISDGIDTLYGWINVTIGSYGSCNYTINKSAIQKGQLSLGQMKTPSDLGVKIFPNPTSSIINIKRNSNSFFKRAELYNLEGKIIMIKILSNEETSINLNDFIKGIYILKLFDSNSTATYKIIKI
jgi:hypothetical protein